MFTLFDDQVRTIQLARDSFKKGKRKILIVSPTGSGKTVMAASIIHAITEKGGTALFTAPRRELIKQTVDKLEMAGVDHGIIMAGEKPRLMPGVQVASVPSLHRRVCVKKKMAPPPAKVVFLDEVHLGSYGMTSDLLDLYPKDVVVIGLTATPAAPGGKKLGIPFEEMVMGPSTAELISLGRLCPIEYYAPSKPDLNGIRIKQGDYDEGQLVDRMNVPKLVGDVVSNWHRIASDRQTLVFAINVAHSMALKDSFVASGVKAEHIDGETPTDERDAILDRYRKGETWVLCSCGVMTTGTDLPMCSCIVMARPTKSLVLYLQIGGRGMRVHPGKANMMFLDHAGVIDEHGYLDDPIPWSLTADDKVQDRKKLMKRPVERKPVTCPACKYVFSAARTCPACGHEMHKYRAKDVEVVDGELHRLDRNGNRIKKEFTMQEKGKFFAELKGHGNIKGYKEGWAAWAYRERFKVWPDHSIRDVPQQIPSLATAAWIKFLNIKRAKSLAKGANAAA